MFIKKKTFNKFSDKKSDRKKTREPLKKRVYKKKPCRFCIEKIEYLGYLDYPKFQKLLSERGKILPSRITGNCAKHQRQLARAIKRARIAGLLAFVAD